MARFAVIGEAGQELYLSDKNDLTPTKIGDVSILGNLLVGEKHYIDKIKYSAGGGALNVAVSLARYGHDVVIMTNLGQDSAGDAVMRVLDLEEIDNSYVNFVNNKPTCTSMILTSPKQHENTVLKCRGACENFANLDPSDLETIYPDYLYLTTLNGDFEMLEKILKKTQEIHCKIVMNPGEAELSNSKRLLKLLKYVDILILNKKEAAELVPGNILSELLYHLNGYVPIVVITDGLMGGIAGKRNTKDIYRFGIYEDVKMRDKTGAGDAFGAGVAGAWADGKSLRQALAFASANATAVIKKVGGFTGALDANEVLHPMPIQKV